MKKVLVISASPRKNGNSDLLCDEFVRGASEAGHAVEKIRLAEKNVGFCSGCYACQNVSDEYGCVQKDDAEEIWRQIGETDLLVLATPIYSWYCTAEMKALMDRHYALNKYYGSGQGQLIPRLSVALLTTHGYKDEYANEPFETGIRRLCKHCHWDYLGRYSARDIDGISDMQTEEAMEGARRFADELLQKFNAKC